MAMLRLVVLSLLSLSAWGGTLLKRASLQAPYDQQNCTTNTRDHGCCQAPQSSPAGTFEPATLCWQSDAFGEIFKVDAGSYGMYQISVNRRIHGDLIYGGFSGNINAASFWPLNGYYSTVLYGHTNGHYSNVSCDAIKESANETINMTNFYSGPLQAQVNKFAPEDGVWFESSTYNDGQCSSLYGRGGPFYPESVRAIPWWGSSEASKVAAEDEHFTLVV